MRAAVLTEYGSVPKYAEADEPIPSGDQVVVDVLAAGLNAIDLAMASGTLPGPRPPLPAVAGGEGVGRLRDGRRVYFVRAAPPSGSFAERCLVAPPMTIPLDDAVDDATAIAVGNAGLAAWLALEHTAQLAPGETVLVLGASGAVGQIGVQAARHLGAGRVVAAARHHDGLDRARLLGADAVVDLNGDDIGSVLSEAAPHGYDVVLDPLWGGPALAALAALAPRGRLIQVGNSAAATIELPAGLLRARVASIRAHTGMAVTPPQMAAAHARMVGLALRGDLRVAVEEVPLADISTAWQRQANSPHVKLVLIPGQ